LESGDTVGHAGIFDPSCELAPLCLLSSSPSTPHPCLRKECFGENIDGIENCCCLSYAFQFEISYNFSSPRFMEEGINYSMPSTPSISHPPFAREVFISIARKVPPKFSHNKFYVPEAQFMVV
jgi:hypothetical protein